MFKLPPLSHDGLTQLVLCGHIDATDYDDDLLAWAQNADSLLIARHGDDPATFVRRIVDAGDSSHLHFHLEAATSGVFAKDPKAADDLSKALEFNAAINGVRIEARIRASRMIHLKDLPRQGVFSTLLGLTTAAGKSEVTLTGCTLDVTGDGSFTEVEAHVLDKDVAIFHCEAIDVFEVTEDLLRDAEDLLLQGFNSLVFEEAIEEERSND